MTPSMYTLPFATAIYWAVKEAWGLYKARSASVAESQSGADETS
jgi:hypothetical protein